MFRSSRIPIEMARLHAVSRTTRSVKNNTQFSSRKEHNSQTRGPSRWSIITIFFNIAIDFLARWVTRLTDLQLIRASFPRCQNILLYADDTIIFLKAHRQQISVMKIILHAYARLSGLKINLQKSELLLIASNAEETQQCSILSLHVFGATTFWQEIDKIVI
jgi:Reverse transcriptase (RNA-dependent DNA polymerase)